MGPSFLRLFATEHPALVHVPLGLALCLPLLVAPAFRSPRPRIWLTMAFRLGILALGGSALALASGLLWGRQLALIPPGGFLPVVASPGQVLQATLRAHALAALAGFVLGLVSLGVLARARRVQGPWVAASLVAVLAWAGAWGFAGRQGGILVFGNAETSRAAAALLETRRLDAEAELPIRALDYASLEPLRELPFRSRAHGDRMARSWVTASALEALIARAPLPVGAYAVLSTTLDTQGGPPGPLYMRETRADGTQAYAFYWPRVPPANRGETGGEDYVYWRSPHPRLRGCAECH